MLIDPKTLPQVAMDFMNQTHDEDVAIINSLYDHITAYEAAPSEALETKINEAYTAWFEHTIEHFRVEEERMIAQSFPPYPMHKGEHENELRLMDETFRHWQAEHDINALKSYMTSHLVPWLINHINTMDTITARFFNTGMSPCSIH